MTSFVKCGDLSHGPTDKINPVSGQNQVNHVSFMLVVVATPRFMVSRYAVLVRHGASLDCGFASD